ncbi:hypothetical protein AMS68_000567 [Peltaster fructicola]|uniref:Histone chaperone domain-containing protein n=1 Tax=Peltaster fructicola TaxID=286661 RepID=A0A6H0XKL5_9PEZI|nr:hypothetical protein AMS68_000567 [Peltaster fructicola]
MSASADDRYEQENDQVSGDVPAGDAVDNDYKSRPGQSEIPVVADEKPVDDPIDPATADSDETLEADERNAIDESNIMESRTRGAAPKEGSYTEPGDEEGLPGPEDGTSSGAQ